MKFTHPSGKEITVEPINVYSPDSGPWWCAKGLDEVRWQRTYGRLCGVVRRKMKREGWTEVKS